jgi:CO/xanthine dehydrogenase Mo-binding subunit
VVAALDCLRRIVRALQRSHREAETRLGVSGAQLLILQVLAGAPELSVTELAERTFTHQSTVSTVVDRLVSRGLVKRERAAGDGRIGLVDAGPLPPGWMGKPHACRRGAEEAGADWLCFVDADVRCSPLLLASAVAAAEAGGALRVESAGAKRSDRAPQSCIVAYAVEVEVDPESGRVTPRKLTAVHDVGRAVNPALLQAQIDGATIQGLGQALMEDLARQDGVPQATNLGDYKLPSAADIPELVSVFVEDAPGPGPYAAKAVA